MRPFRLVAAALAGALVGTLAAPVAAAPRDPGFRYIATQTDGRSPITWDGCQPVVYKINRANMSDAEVARMMDAVNAVATRTGQTWQFAGHTDFVPSRGNVAGMRAAHGADVVLSYATPGTGPDQSTMLGESSLASAGFMPGTKEDRRDYAIVGYAVFHTSRVMRLKPSLRRATYLHELAHVAGLADIGNRADLMFGVTPKSGKITKGYAAGLRALKKAGACRV